MLSGQTSTAAVTSAARANGWPKLLLALLHAFLLLAPLNAVAAGQSRFSTAVFIDPSASLHIEEVVQKDEFQAYEGGLRLGYIKAATWIRIEVEPGDDPELILAVRPAYLDDVRLYVKDEAGNWAVRQAGDHFSYAQRERPELDFSFTVRTDATSTSTYYLRVQTESTSQIAIRLLTPEQSHREDTFSHLTLGMYIGLVAILLITACVGWVSVRDSLWAFNAQAHLITLFWLSFGTGIGAKYGMQDALQHGVLIGTLMPIIHLASGSLMAWMLFRAYQAPGLTTLTARLSVFAFPVLVGMVLLGSTQAALKINAQLLLLQTLQSGIGIWFVTLPDRLIRYTMRLGMMLLFLYLIAYVPAVLGHQAPAWISLYPAFFPNIILAAMHLIVLVRRTQLAVRERTQLQHSVDKINEELRWEASRRYEATNFISMLLHEVKTPLAAISLATQTLLSTRSYEPAMRAKRLYNIQRAVSDIDGVLERCVQTDRLEHGSLTIKRQHLDMALLLQQWCLNDLMRDRIRLQGEASLHARLDPQLLHMMLRNLLTNALAYSPPYSLVDVTLTRRDSTCGPEPVPGFAIEVRNDVGRAGAPDPEKVFKKYYRSPTARHSSGTGLGLYWVKGAAELQGGKLRYLSQPQFVSFELWLPS